MPGEEHPPNLTAAETIAYAYNIMGNRDWFLDQFPVTASTDKVQKFCDVRDNSNVSIRFDNTLFNE
ncbi:MAG: hypothetical protein KAJ07_09120 [Planctomycetes bacterium]|nr:hypothetical protein [Planctomycetota bacterium]